MVDRRCRRGLAIVLTTAFILSASAQNAYAFPGKSNEGLYSRVSELRETLFEKTKDTNVLQLFVAKIKSKLDERTTRNDNTIVFAVITMPQSQNEASNFDDAAAIISQADEPDTGRDSGASRGSGILFAEDDVTLLAKIIYAEARGESFEGQVAVGAVVLNRVESTQFPDTIEEVIYQPGQFSAVSDRQIELTPDDEAYQAALAAIEGQDPTNGAVFYYNPITATDNWIKTRDVVKSIGNHKFCV